MRTRHYGFWVALCANRCVYRQREGSNRTRAAPIPAYKSPLGAGDVNNPTNTNSQQVTPDTSSLSGFQNFSLGLPTARSYWQPHAELSFGRRLEWAGNPQRNFLGGMVGIVSGGVDVHRTSGEFEFGA